LKPHKVQAQVPLLLTSGAAAAYLGVHANTLRQWANEGTIQSMRLANARRDRRFSRQALDKFLIREMSQ
jgi:excisionase family DNA binding protein